MEKKNEVKFLMGKYEDLIKLLDKEKEEKEKVEK